jgi:hypothetical protein
MGLCSSVCVGLWVAGCQAKSNTDDDTGPTSSPSGDTGEETADDFGDDDTQGSGDDDPSGTDTSNGSDGDDDAVGSSGDGANFILEPDGNAVANECDIWAQDCMQGEKCMPWANDGAGSWNATRCSPLDRNPAQPGDPCMVEGSGVSGIDDCDISTMCWDVDPETNMGTCVQFCSGSEANPVCEDPTTSCVIANEGVLILCLPGCDPLVQDCMEGNACYPSNDTFVCGPDASQDQGVYADPCEFVNVCDPGLFCANAELVPDCASTSCCSPYCDTSDPDASAACPGSAAGQECVPWFEEGQVPPGFENVGACGIPA